MSRYKKNYIDFDYESFKNTIIDETNFETIPLNDNNYNQIQKTLQNTDKNLKNANIMLDETLQTGQYTLKELNNQNHTIVKINSHLTNTNNQLGKSSNILNRMLCTSKIQKIMSIVLIVILILIIILVLILKYIKK